MPTVNITLLGAGGKIGFRVAQRLASQPDFRLSAVEPSPQGQQRLADAGIGVVEAHSAVHDADVVVFAVPDRHMQAIAADIVPRMRSGALAVGLDPAAAYAGVLPDRQDIAWFITHPCHPPLFGDEQTPEQRADWFGGVHAPQSIVCSLCSGDETHYLLGERIARLAFAPILRTHRITLEQMAILEPGLVESTSLALLSAIRDALDRTIAMGVPEAAARDFLLGHLRVELGIVLGIADVTISDGARMAMEDAKRTLLPEDWLERVLSTDSVRDQVRRITGAEMVS